MAQERNTNIGIRLAAMLLDHFIMTFVLVILAFILFGIQILIFGNLPETNFPSGLFYIPMLLVLFLFSIYLNKDAVKGKSPAKRILGLVIVDNQTGKIANPVKAVIRNLTLIFWPIEVIFSLFSPERRIGDYIAGTKVIVDDKTLITEIKTGNIILALIIGIGYMIGLLLLQLAITGISLLEFF